MTLSKTLRSLCASTLLAISATTFHQFINPSAAAAADVDPVNIYAQLPRTSSVRVSPDGKYIAMLSPYKSSKAVFVYNLDNANAKPIVIPTPKNAIVKYIDWSSDNHITMAARYRRFKSQGKMRKYSTLFTRWFSTNIKTKKTVMLMEDKIEKEAYQIVTAGTPVHDLPDDPEHILMGFAEYADNRPVWRHYTVNLNTGKSGIKRTMPYDTQHVVMTLNGQDLIARENYNDSLGKYKVFTGSGMDEELIYSEDFDKNKNPTTHLITETGGKLLFQKSEKQSLTLFTIDPETKQQAPFSLNTNVPAGYAYAPIFDNFTRELIGISYTDDYTRQVYSAEPYKGWHAKAKRALKGQNVRILSRTRDNSEVTLFAEGPTNPGEYYLFETKTGSISSLGGEYPELNSSKVGKTIRADFVARDGLKIPAYLTLPPGTTKANGPMPAVILPHGGPIARDDATFDFWAQYLARQGYVVFKPQFRGSSGFGYNHEKKGYGEFGAGMLEDTVDGVKHLISTGLIDEERICVTGASYGGYQALALPVIEPDLFRCAIAVNGVSDIPDIYAFTIAKFGRESGATRFWDRIIGNTNDRDSMKSQSPSENADKIKAEVLLVHGTDDMTVPLQQSKAMAKALKKTGKPDKIIMLPDDDHNLSLPQSRMTLLKASEELFAKHLK